MEGKRQLVINVAEDTESRQHKHHILCEGNATTTIQLTLDYRLSFNSDLLFGVLVVWWNANPGNHFSRFLLLRLNPSCTQS
jgi:hypothetical protein